MTGKEICLRAAEYESYKYWYGAKGEIATKVLADRLRKENPSNWSQSYYDKALRDIDGKQRVCDCSGLVCHAYGIGTINSTSIRNKYPRWNGQPKTGMILWRQGHVGIYDGGKVRELKGIDYDYCFNAYNPAQWSEVHYDPKVDYDGIKVGWTNVNGQWLYSEDGKDYVRNSWRWINGHWYYFGADGFAYTGKHKIGTETFYFASIEESVDFECSCMRTNDRGAFIIWDVPEETL